MFGSIALSTYMDAMKGLAVTTSTKRTSYKHMFQKVLGDSWQDLPQEVSKSYQVIDEKYLAGFAKVTRGSGLQANLIAWLFGFPKAAENVPVSVRKSCIKESQTWTRTFGKKTFESQIRPTGKSHSI